MRILLVEDDKLIGDGIKAGLSKMGFNVDWFTDGKTGQAALYTAPYDAVVLDLTLPEIDGLEILRAARKRKERTGADPDRAGCAESARRRVTPGADDYLCKPFALIEVAARLESLVRRSHGQARSELRHGKVTLDPASLVATLEGETLVLKPKEFALLELLMRNAGRVLPRKAIEEKLYNWDDDVSSNAVEVHVHHLRRKLGSDFIRTVHGIGYTRVTHETDPTPEPEAAPDAPLLLLSPAARFAASVVARHQTTDKLDKLFDTQQMLFAKRLLTMDVDELRAPERMREVPKSQTRPS